MQAMKRAGLMPMVALLLLTTACASGGTGTSSHNLSELTRAEIEEAPVSNLYEVVERLRPRWLQVRAPKTLNGGPTEVVVFMDRSYLGGTDVLRQFNKFSVEKLRYLDAASAYASLAGIGQRSIEGAIVIEMSPGK
jgi:hypothetical protein